jgi:putative hydrolase of the HAD superfamily
MARKQRVFLMDLGGVLVDVDHGRTYAALGALTARPAVEVEAAFEASGVARAFNLGQLGPEEFCDALGELLGRGLSRNELVHAWCQTLRPWAPTGRLIRALAEQGDLYLLSNTDPIHFEAVRRLAGAWLGAFRGLHLSYEVGVAKPDRAFFEGALEHFRLGPQQCVFFDDLSANVAAAASCGIWGYVVHGGGLTPDQLRECGLWAAKNGGAPSGVLSSTKKI